MDNLKQSKRLSELFDYAAALYPHHVAVEFYDGLSKQSLEYCHVSGQATFVQHFLEKQFFALRKEKKKSISSDSPTPKNALNCVGLFMTENCFLCSLLIGIFKAGSCYLPFNPFSPKAVIAHLIQSTQLQFVLTSGTYQERLCHDFGFTKLDGCDFTLNDSTEGKQIFFLLSRIALHSDGENIGKLFPTNLAYILTTSGTTGCPKLVFVPHQCILPNVIHLKQIYEVDSQDKVALCSPLTFDPSIVEIFTALSSGAALVIVSNSVKYRPFVLADVLFNIAKVSVMQCTPTLFTRFSSDVLKTVFSLDSSLRVLVFGGEPCPSYKTINNWFESSLSVERRNRRIINIYGISEVSSWSTFYEVELKDILKGNDNPIPLGYPLLQTVLQIVSENKELLCQIWSCATSVAANHAKKKIRLKLFRPDNWLLRDQCATAVGYLLLGSTERLCYMVDDPDAICSDSNLTMRNSGDLAKVVVTKQCFEKLRDSSSREATDVNYTLHYLGRNDGQIKRHGKRMNILTVKQKLNELQNISASHVLHLCFKNKKYSLYFKNFSLLKHDLLIAFVVCQSEQTSKHIIFEHLKSTLDAHYLPDDIIFIDNLPLTHHGKVDDMALMTLLNKNPLTSTNEEMQYRLLALWQNALNQIGDKKSLQSHLNDNFVASGGDSFAAVKLLNMIENEFGKSGDDLKTLKVILNGTLRDVLDWLTSDSWSSESADPSSTQVFDDSEPPQTCSQVKNRKSRLSSLPQQRENKKYTANGYVSLKRGNVLMSHDWDQSTHSATERKLTHSDVLFSVNLLATFCLSIRWKYDSEKCIDASPLVVVSDHSATNGIVIIGSHSSLLASVNITSGVIDWKIKLAERIESSACLSSCGRYVIVGCYDYCVYVVDAFNGSIFWKFRTGDLVKSSPCCGPLSSNVVFVGSHDGFLYCLDVQRRSVEWKYNGRSGAIFSSPLFHSNLNEECEGVVYGCTLGGLVFCLDAGDGEERWTHKLPKPVFSSPAICGKGLCVGCVDNFIYMLQKDSGHMIWKFETKQPVFSSPAVASFSDASSSPSRVVLCGSHDGRTYCLNCNDGTLLWSYPGSEQPCLPPVYATPFPTNFRFRNEVFNVVVTASTDGTVSILNCQDGRCIAKQILPSHVFSSPILLGHDDDWSLLVGCRNNYLYCFRLDLSS